MFRCKALKFRCALDILLLSIISKSKSFNCMLTSSIVIFQAAVWSIMFDNFWDTNDLSFNVLFTIDLFLNNDLFYNCIPHVCLTFPAHQRPSNIESPITRHDPFGQVCTLILWFDFLLRLDLSLLFSEFVFIWFVWSSFAGGCKLFLWLVAVASHALLLSFT